MENTVWATSDDYTILGSAAYRFVKEHRARVEECRAATQRMMSARFQSFANTHSRSVNVAFVFEQDGTVRAAQSTETGARRYMTPERILVLTKEGTA